MSTESAYRRFARTLPDCRGMWFLGDIPNDGVVIDQSGNGNDGVLTSTRELS